MQSQDIALGAYRLAWALRNISSLTCMSLACPLHVSKSMSKSWYFQEVFRDGVQWLHLRLSDSQQFTAQKNSPWQSSGTARGTARLVIAML